jgi:hypothetical protein
MPQITSPVPQNNVAVASQETAATNLLTEIKSLLNGGLAVDNLSLALRSLASPPRVTSLPSTPSDGDIVDFIADASAGVVWRLRYRASSSSSYKWEYVGGGPAGLSQGSLNITVPAGTNSPDLLPWTPPVAGDYWCDPSVVAGSTTGWTLFIRRTEGSVNLASVGFRTGNGNDITGRMLRLDNLLATKQIAPIVAAASGSDTLVSGVSFFLTPIRVG